MREILRFLINCLSKYYQQKVILLIDEYDTPLLTAHEFGYYNEALQYTNEIFSLMLYSGYLTIKKEIADNVFTIRIPNKEITSFFHNTFIEIMSYKKY